MIKLTQLFVKTQGLSAHRIYTTQKKKIKKNNLKLEGPLALDTTPTQLHQKQMMKIQLYASMH